MRVRQILFIEASLCTGCRSCQVACQMEHDLPAGVCPIRVIQLGPFPTDDSARGRAYSTAYLPATCAHCADPACVRVCSQKAMQQRPDGIVFSDRAKCIGCQTCVTACPYAAPLLNPSTGVIAKCDHCLARLERGLSPACVLKCPTGALSFGATNWLVGRIQRREAECVVEAMPQEWRWLEWER